MRGRKKDNLKGLLFVGPTLLVLLVVYLYPLIQNVNYSLRNLGVEGRPFSGLRNYLLMFDDPIFLTSIRNNSLLIFLLVPLLVLLCLVFALPLFERVHGWKFYRGTILLPYITSITAVGLFFSLFFQGRGMLNTFLQMIGLGSLVVDWLGSTRFAMPAIMFVIVWREFGFGTMLFLARLTTVSEELFDAAKIDGASEAGILVRIVLPLSTAVIATIALFHAVGQWNSYFNALIYIRNKLYHPLQIYLRNYITEDLTMDMYGGNLDTSTLSTPEQMRAGIIVFATLPILLVYPFLQKYFVKGAMLGSVKG